MSRLFYLALLSVTFSNCVDGRNDLGRVFTALDDVLSYIFEHYTSINIDGLFGIVFGQAHLDKILEKDFEGLNRMKVMYLKNKADSIYAFIKPRLYNQENYQHNLFIEKILVPSLWKRDIDFRSNGIDLAYRPGVKGFDLKTRQGYLDYLTTSNISETLSDACLFELLPGSNERPHNCSVTEVCKSYMVNNEYFDPTYGITHRLLYLQIAGSQKCSMDKEMYQERVSSYCSHIYWEAKMNVNFGFIEELDDLLLEQITLCGFEGFVEFLGPALINHVMEIQTEYGCFSIPHTLFENVRTSKRTANIIRYGCNDHTTGLGVSSLSLILRYLLDN